MILYVCPYYVILLHVPTEALIALSTMPRAATMYSFTTAHFTLLTNHTNSLSLGTSLINTKNR